MAGDNGDIRALQEQIAVLTRRIFAIEQRLNIPLETSGVRREPPAAEPVKTPPLEHVAVPPVPVAPPTTYFRSANEPFASLPTRSSELNLEKKIGQYWLNRIGILAVLVGVAYFLKLAFDNHWIGETGRIAIGLLGGSGLIVWSERFRSHGHKAFSYSLKALGIGTLYLSLWAAFQLYNLIPSSVAFLAMIVVTAATITFSLTQNSQLLAAFALLFLRQFGNEFDVWATIPAPEPTMPAPEPPPVAPPPI